MEDREKEPVDLNRTWEFGLDRAAFTELSRDEGFRALLALCRLMNLLRFATLGVYGIEGSASPFARRQSMMSFSLSCALLYEAHTYIVHRLGKSYGTEQVYRDGLGAWGARRDVREFIEVNCKPFRHETVFHVLIDAVPGNLARVENEWSAVMSGRGTMKGFRYYDLADQVALAAFIGDREAEDARAYITGLASRATELTKAFMTAADDLIWSVVTKPPFRLRQGQDTQEPAWVTFQQKRESVVPPDERPPHLVEPV
jgi:hypothetical protein